MTLEQITLGREYRDQITGFAGVATGKVEYVSGCHQVSLAPPVKDDGAFRASEWFDVQRLELASDRGPIVLDNTVSPGHDAPAPRR